MPNPISDLPFMAAIITSEISGRFVPIESPIKASIKGERLILDPILSIPSTSMLLEKIRIIDPTVTKLKAKATFEWCSLAIFSFIANLFRRGLISEVKKKCQYYIHNKHGPAFLKR